MKAFVVGLIAVFGLSAHSSQLGASAHISKTIAFPVASLQKVEQAMQTAAARQGEDMNKIVDYDIDTQLRVRCFENSPTVYDGHLYGCALQLSVDLGGGTTGVLQNLLYPTQTSFEVQDLLNKTDANKVDHVALTGIFDGGNGSAYSCNAEGSSGARAWNCYLNFID